MVSPGRESARRTIHEGSRTAIAAAVVAFMGVLLALSGCSPGQSDVAEPAPSRSLAPLPRCKAVGSEVATVLTEWKVDEDDTDGTRVGPDEISNDCHFEGRLRLGASSEGGVDVSLYRVNSPGSVSLKKWTAGTARDYLNLSCMGERSQRLSGQFDFARICVRSRPNFVGAAALAEDGDVLIVAVRIHLSEESRTDKEEFLRERVERVARELFRMLHPH